MRNARVLLRAVAGALRTRVSVNPELVMALATLAAAVDALSDQLVAGADPQRARTLAIQASAQATEVLAMQHDLRTSMIIGQIRATTVDLLWASGLDGASAREAIPSAPTEHM